ADIGHPRRECGKPRTKLAALLAQPRTKLAELHADLRLKACRACLLSGERSLALTNFGLLLPGTRNRFPGTPYLLDSSRTPNDELSAVAPEPEQRLVAGPERARAADIARR